MALNDGSVLINADIAAALGKGDPWESGMDLDLELLTDELIALCAEYAEGDQPCYEL